MQLRELRVHVSQAHSGGVHSLVVQSIHAGTCRTLQCMPQLDSEEPEKLLGGRGTDWGLSEDLAFLLYILRLDFHLNLWYGPGLVDMVLGARKADWSRTLGYL